MAALSDEELCRVGVTTIGDRLRLRDLCAVAEKDPKKSVHNKYSATKQVESEGKA